jgi:hypothetical protein
MDNVQKFMQQTAKTVPATYECLSMHGLKHKKILVDRTDKMLIIENNNRH